VSRKHKTAAEARGRIPSWIKKVGLLVASSFICLVLLEVAFRLAGYQAIYDIYSKPELFWKHDDLLGWSHEPGAQGTYVGPRPFPVEFSAPVRINSLGLRGPEIPELPPGGLRVLVLGDSVVAGFEVAEDKTFTALLEKRLAADLAVPVQVINAGIRGYGTDQTYLYYRERGRKLRPHLVLLLHSNNDPEDNTTLHRARRPFGKPAFALKADRELELIGHPIPDYPTCSAYRLDAQFRVVRLDSALARTLCWLQVSLTDHSALLTFMIMRIQQSPHFITALYELGTPKGQREASGHGVPVGSAHILTTSLIQRLAAEIRADKSQVLIFGAKDDIEQLDVQALRSVAELVYRDDIGSFDHRLHAFRSDSHYNEAGHALVAGYLAPLLSRRLSDLSKSAAGPAALEHAPDGEAR